MDSLERLVRAGDHKDKWGYAGPWPGFGSTCPDCGGRLESVTW